MTIAASSARLALRSAFRPVSMVQQCRGPFGGYACEERPAILVPMTPPTKSGDDQTIEVQYTLEDEVLIVEHLDDSPEDFGESLARTLGAPGPAEGERELEAGLGGTGASIQRVSRRPR